MDIAARFLIGCKWGNKVGRMGGRLVLFAMTGNLDSDGHPEIAVTAPEDDTRATNAGAVWLITLDGFLYPLAANLLGVVIDTMHPVTDPGLLSTYDVNHDGKADIGDFVLLDLLGKAGN